MIPKMFHVKHFGPVAAQNLTRWKTEILRGKVRTSRILVQLKSAGESRFFGVPQSPAAPQCKIGWKSVPPQTVDDGRVLRGKIHLSRRNRSASEH
jgi:hypothetical protein